MKELAYRQAGDYLIPDLTLDGAEDLEEMPLGKYGMLLTGRLEPHLREIDRQAQAQVDQMVAGLMKQSGVDEALKARDQMGWVQAVNRFTAQAEEQVLAEIVYR